MKRIIAILGTLLTVIILISGPTVATWVYAHYIAEDNTTSIGNIDILDNAYASLGEHIPPADPVLGWVLLDLGLDNEMPPNQDFTVFAQTPVEESYDVWVGETTDIEYRRYVGRGNDTRNETFTTPSDPDAAEYRYIFIDGVTGIDELGDYAYGPDIDAVGWNKP